MSLRRRGGPEGELLELVGGLEGRGKGSLHLRQQCLHRWIRLLGQLCSLLARTS